jgi:hypothetical protein
MGFVLTWISTTLPVFKIQSLVCLEMPPRQLELEQSPTSTVFIKQPLTKLSPTLKQLEMWRVNLMLCCTLHWRGTLGVLDLQVLSATRQPWTQKFKPSSNIKIRLQLEQQLPTRLLFWHSPNNLPLLEPIPKRLCSLELSLLAM